MPTLPQPPRPDWKLQGKIAPCYMHTSFRASILQHRDGRWAWRTYPKANSHIWGGYGYCDTIGEAMDAAVAWLTDNNQL